MLALWLGNVFPNDDIRTAVRDQYGSIARGTTGGCCAAGTCGPGAEASLALGYSAEDLAAVPEGANMGLGCGKPQAIAALRAEQRGRQKVRTRSRGLLLHRHR